LENHPDCGPCYGRLSVVYLEKENYKLAKENLEKAIQFDRHNTILRYNLGIIYFKEKNYRKAIDQFKKAIEIDPKFPSAYRSLGICYESLGERHKAKQYYEQYQRMATQKKIGAIGLVSIIPR
jgi:Tfp pilus assembly protein PilF